MENNRELEEIFYLFFRNRIKAYLVATGTNDKYKDIRDKYLENEVEKIIGNYSIENIFMGQGIAMLVSSFETFLRRLFISQAQNNKEVEDKIRKETKQPRMAIEDVIKKNRPKFSFQNLDTVSKNFEKYLNINLREIFNEAGNRFKHANEDEQNRIMKSGFFKYFSNDIWPLRHTVIHESKVPRYGKAIWGVCFNALNIISGEIENSFK